MPLLPLYHPLAMRVASDHILRKSERKIWVQTFDSSITPSLMPYAAGIKVNALFLPSLVPRTLSSLSHTSVIGSFNNFEHKLRPHSRFSKEMCHPFAILSVLSGSSQ